MNKLWFYHSIAPLVHTFLKKMKLTTFILCITTLVSFGSISSYAQSKKLTIIKENVKVIEILNEIENQTEFRFFYSNDVDIDREISINMENKATFEILDEIFKQTDVNYKVHKRQIALVNKSNDLKKNQLSNQQKFISGKVTDSKNQPLPGVTVMIKGTTNGTVTDNQGNYTIPNISDDAIIVFSFIGMISQELDASGKRTINVTMTEETFGIEEVVAIGYGSIKKSDLSGSVASINGEDLANRQTTQISQALQGAISGVNVTRNNNAPGSSATIRIRGITTIGNNNPLVIVDGIPIDNINDINPNHIQHVSVLKDAASASIYGSRAAAGVILITTKRAKKGELKLTYNAEYGIEKPTTFPKYVDAVRFMQFDNEMRWNDNNNTGTEYSTYPKKIVENYWSLNSKNPNKYPNTDWRDLVLKDYAPRTSHNISISAGEKNFSSKISLNYDKIEGLYKFKKFERFNARFNNDLVINKYISASADIFWKRSIYNNASTSPWFQLLIAPSIYPAVWDDGRIASGKAGANIYGMIEKGGTSDNCYNLVGGKASVDIAPVKGLKLSVIIAPNFNFNKGKSFRKSVKTSIYEDPTVVEGNLEGYNSTILSESRNDNYQVTTQFLANYLNSFGNHNMNIMAGYENYYAFYEGLGASRDKFLLNSFPYLNLGPLEYRDNSGSASENAYRSYFGRMMYNYKNKYYLQANIRYDGSSRFHKNYRWGAFPSFSAGWILSEEKFMAEIDNLSFLKLRASWGSLGNERIGNYPYQATIAFNDALFYEGSEVVSAQTAAQVKYAINDISWETTESIDLGIDANFFNNRLKFTYDYYLKTTKDMLLALEIPDFIGFENPEQNTGKMKTKGWDAEIRWNNKIGKLQYSLSFNISDFKSKMGNLGGTEFIGAQIKKEGSEFNEWYGYIAEGLFQTPEELKNSPKTSENVKIGDLKYKDISGPDGKPDGIISPEYDRVLLGGSLPRYIFGSNLNLKYKGIDLSLVLQGVGKQNCRLTSTMIEPLRANWGNVPDFIDGNYWSAYNTAEQNLKVKYPRLSWSSSGNNYTMSNYWLFNGGYLRLKNITLGYTLPDNIINKATLSKIRIYSTISDLFSINNYPKGWDPEFRGGYPITKSYVFGISVNF